MSRRAARWWRPTTQRRPAQRARQRRMYTEQEMLTTFDTAYECGQGDERKRHEQRDEWLRRVAEACDEGPDAVTALAREVGVMPGQPAERSGTVSGPLDEAAEQLVDEVERWLRDQQE